MKIAKVVPLYKSSDRSNASNYRPISLLPCLSKVIEKLIYSRLTNFLNKHSILHQNQYDFHQGLSTSHALIDIATRIYDSIEKSFYTALVFVDYQKAFDTVCHGILFSKLERYGIRGSALGLIPSYLNNRKQSVNNNGYLCAPQNITYGVPQGSIWRPLLFLLYDNDIHKVVDHLNMAISQYADDTCLIVNALNPEELESRTNYLFSLAKNWSTANKLIINTSKTKAMIIVLNYLHLP